MNYELVIIRSFPVFDWEQGKLQTFYAFPATTEFLTKSSTAA